MNERYGRKSDAACAILGARNRRRSLETQNKAEPELGHADGGPEAQRGLFDGVDLGKPSANQGEGAEMLYTQADDARWEFKITSQLDDSPDLNHMLVPDTVMPTTDADESLAVLADIDLDDSITQFLGYA